MTDKQNNDLIQPIVKTDILKAIQKGKNGRSPGSDGFTYEFYKELRYLVCPMGVFSEILQTGNGPDTWNWAIITVIPKEGKEPTECSSYRPISLLNVDKKLFTSIIAKRLSYILRNTINLDQTGFVKDRK